MEFFLEVYSLERRKKRNDAGNEGKEKIVKELVLMIRPSGYNHMRFKENSLMKGKSSVGKRTIGKKLPLDAIS